MEKSLFTRNSTCVDEHDQRTDAEAKEKKLAPHHEMSSESPHFVAKDVLPTLLSMGTYDSPAAGCSVGNLSVRPDPSSELFKW